MCESEIWFESASADTPYDEQRSHTYTLVTMMPADEFRMNSTAITGTVIQMYVLVNSFIDATITWYAHHSLQCHGFVVIENWGRWGRGGGRLVLHSGVN